MVFVYKFLALFIDISAFVLTF